MKSPRNLIRSLALGFLLAAPFSVAQGTGGTEGDFPIPPPDRPELALPLFDRKMVIAHNMTEEVSRYLSGIDVDLYRPDGSTAALGGIHQFLPMDPVVYQGKVRTLEEAAESEIRAARLLGLDGFQFYFPHNLNGPFMYRYCSNVVAHVKAAQRVDPAFRLTVCFAPLDKVEASVRLTNYARFLKFMLDATAGCDTWLKTPDGRHIFFTWIGDNILPDLKGRHWEIGKESRLLGKVAGAFDRIAAGAGVRGAFIHQLRWTDRPEYLSNFYSYFPAGWNWTESADKIPAFQAVAAMAREKKRLFSYTAWNDFYTSKVFKKGTWDMYYDAQKAAAAGISTLGRHGKYGGLSANWRAWLDAAMEDGGPLVNVATWNDFREGHHLAPEVNHNFASALLLQYYKRRWLGVEPAVDRETVMVFYKKYPKAAVPSPFFIPMDSGKEGDDSLEDGVEVVTLLTEPGEVWLNNRMVGTVAAGLGTLRVPPLVGKISAEVRRKSLVACRVDPPEWMTDAPYRTDRLTYMYSSRCPELFRAIYGKDAVQPLSIEYVETVPGTPNWKSRVKAATNR